MATELKKTSKEWYAEDTEGMVIYDPDGWDRKNYYYSFNIELVTKEEYDSRRDQSTVLRHITPIARVRSCNCATDPGKQPGTCTTCGGEIKLHINTL